MTKCLDCKIQIEEIDGIVQSEYCESCFIKAQDEEN